MERAPPNGLSRTNRATRLIERDGPSDFEDTHQVQAPAELDRVSGYQGHVTLEPGRWRPFPRSSLSFCDLLGGHARRYGVAGPYKPLAIPTGRQRGG